MSSVGSFQNKVVSYIQDNKSLAKIHSIPLWHTYTESLPEAEEYAQKVMNSSLSVNLGLGYTALLAYGDISGDSPYVTLNNDDTGGVEYVTECVSNPFEYYFTDLVFLQQKYEEAIIDLYNYKAYALYLTKDEDEYRHLLYNIDESIDTTILLAKESGIQLSKEQIFAKYQAKIEQLIDTFKKDVLNELKNKHATMPSQISLNSFFESIKDLYLEPNLGYLHYRYIFIYIDDCIGDIAPITLLPDYDRYNGSFLSWNDLNELQDAEKTIEIINNKVQEYQLLYDK